MKRFALLDRDGTIIVDRDHISEPGQLELLPGASSGLRRLASMGLGLIVLTNQSVVGRGSIDLQRLEVIHGAFRDLLAAEGIALDGIYACPHVPEDQCPCRKPATGLAERAAGEHGFDPAQSFVIGDKASDIELGRRLGATTILVRTGYGEETARDQSVLAGHVAEDLAAAAQLIQTLLEDPRPRHASASRERNPR